MPENLKADLEETPFVFVYGTLKKGYGNNRILGNSEFMGSGVTISHKHLLFNCGFPYMFLSDNTSFPTGQVLGEVYKVTDVDVLEHLDWLEGVPHHYVRKKVITTVFPTKPCWTYYVAPQNEYQIDDLPLCSFNEGVYEWTR